MKRPAKLIKKRIKNKKAKKKIKDKIFAVDINTSMYPHLLFQVNYTKQKIYIYGKIDSNSSWSQQLYPLSKAVGVKNER